MIVQKVMTSDGIEISARFYGEESGSKGAVLVVPAMGTPQAYYEPFATWLASQGYTVATAPFFWIGHFGFFRAKFAQALWTTYLIPELS